MKIIVYKSKVLGLAIIMGIGAVGFGFFALLGAENKANAIESTLYLSGILIIVVIVVGLIRIKIIDDNTLEYLAWIFYKRRAKISNISKIERSSMYRGLSGLGYSMFVYYKQEGIENAFTIIENQFNLKTIQDLIKNLITINPNIKLDTSYEKLLKEDIKGRGIKYEFVIYKKPLIGALGAFLSGIIFLIGVAVQDKILSYHPFLVLTFPGILGLAISFAAYSVTSKVRTAVKAGLIWYLIIFILLIVSFAGKLLA